MPDAPAQPDGPTILLAGGGTGGHLYPGLAVAEALKRVMPGCRPLFLCTEREIDRVILEPTGFEFIPQPIVPPVKTVGGLLKFWARWRATKDLVRQVLRDRKPLAALGLGGYAAGVAIKAAAHRGVPAALVNPDVIPGKANQYLVRDVQTICCQFAATADHLSGSQRGKVEVTGCPIRPDIIALPSKADALARLGLDPRVRTLVVTGASLGALTVNEAVLALLPSIKLQGWQVLHLAGRDHAAAVREGYRDVRQKADVAVRVIDFTPAMADVWAVADLVVARSGASTCAELTACGLPSILMPYPYHKDLHQRANAKVLADAGAAILLDDEKDARANAARLQPALESLLYDAPKRQTMSAAARALGRPDAADAVAQIVNRLATAGR